MTKREYDAAMKRAKKGDVIAMVRVGSHHYLREEYDEALKWYGRAAAEGDVQAMINLGYVYYYGRLGEVDYESSFKWFSKAAVSDQYIDEEHPEALYKLGDHYRYGKYVDADPNTACLLYERAYEGAKGQEGFWNTKDINHPGLLVADTAFRLGECYRDGLGVKVDLGRALAYFVESERVFVLKVKLGDKFAPGLLRKARAAVDATLQSFRKAN